MPLHTPPHPVVLCWKQQGPNNGPYQWTNFYCLKGHGKLLSVACLLSSGIFCSILKSYSVSCAFREPHSQLPAQRSLWNHPPPASYRVGIFSASQSPLLFLFTSQLTEVREKWWRALLPFPSPLDFKSLPAAWPYLLCKIYLVIHYKLQSLFGPWVPNGELKRVFRCQASKEIEENICILSSSPLNLLTFLEAVPQVSGTFSFHICL